MRSIFTLGQEVKLTINDLNISRVLRTQTIFDLSVGRLFNSTFWEHFEMKVGCKSFNRMMRVMGCAVTALDRAAAKLPGAVIDNVSAEEIH